MDRRLLAHYNRELAHLRETAAEFAREFPKIAGRLALDREAKEVCPDPFVERLLEGFAFLAARVQVKLDAEFPEFTHGLLETIYPHYLCPTPSMAVVQFEPILHDTSLPVGFPIPRGTALRSPLARGQRTACEYRTAHPVTLWPLQIAEVSYHTRELVQFSLLVLLRDQDLRLENRIDANSIALFCSPAINLFERRLDRIPLDHRHHEYQVIPDKTRPFDFEVFEIRSVTGYGAQTGEEQPFLSFYLTRERLSEKSSSEQLRGFYTTRRAERHLTAKERQFGRTHSYIGSDVFLSLVDPAAAPYQSELQQLGVTALCTNRHLPLDFLADQGRSDFTVEINAPVGAIRCVTGPTAPRPALAQGAEAWRLISHLSLNYLSLKDSENGQGANALREMLGLYADSSDRPAQKLVEGVISTTVEPIIRRLETPGPITFVRGMEITAELDELSFEGVGVFIFGAVLSEFFRRYVSINSFTETVIKTRQRKEIMRWAAHPGQRGDV